MCSHNLSKEINGIIKDENEKKLTQRMQDIGFKILVLSGKGGVGKSTVAVNLATALANQEKTVGLLDVDVHGPSIPGLLGLNGCVLQAEDEEILPVEVSERLKSVSIGFLLHNSTDAVIWRGPKKYQVIQQFLTDVRWGKLDYMVVDSPPGTGDEPMSVVQLAGKPCGAVIVTTPQDVAINDVRRCITFCRKMDVPILGIVENMSGFYCPKCGEMTFLFKSGGGQALAKEMNVPFLGCIPVEPQIVHSGDDGVPFINQKIKHAASKEFEKIVEQLILQIQDISTSKTGETK